MSEIEPSKPTLSRIGQLAIPVADLERSVAFYRDVLGMTLRHRSGTELAFFDCSGVLLMLDQPAWRRGNRFGSIVYFTVDNLATTFVQLAEAGVAFEGPPRAVARLADREIWMAFLRDPDGSLIGLMSEVAPD